MNSHVCQGNHMVRERWNISEQHYLPAYMDSICSVSSRIGLSHTGCMGDAMGCQGIVPVVKYGPAAHIWGEKYLRNRHHTNPVHTIPRGYSSHSMFLLEKSTATNVFHSLMSANAGYLRFFNTVNCMLSWECANTKQLHDVWCERIKEGESTWNEVICKH